VYSVWKEEKTGRGITFFPAPVWTFRNWSDAGSVTRFFGFYQRPASPKFA
jgi:hypothetical protein